MLQAPIWISGIIHNTMNSAIELAPSYHVDLSGMYVPCYSCIIKGNKSMDWGRTPWDGPLAGKMGINGMGGETNDCHQQAKDSQCPCLKK